jgi:hypothetical protein
VQICTRVWWYSTVVTSFSIFTVVLAYRPNTYLREMRLDDLAHQDIITVGLRETCLGKLQNWVLSLLHVVP